MKLILRCAVPVVCVFLLVPTVTFTHAGIEPLVSPEARLAAPGMTASPALLISETALAKTNEASPERHRKVTDAYAKLPLSFIENHGQFGRVGTLLVPTRFDSELHTRVNIGFFAEAGK